MPDNFTLIPTGAEVSSAVINLRLQELDNAIAKKNLTASTNPTANDDELDGYEVSSIWVNETEGRIFIAVSVETAAAVWVEMSSVQNNLSATTAPTANDDEDDGYGVGSLWVDTANERSYIAIDVTAAAAVWQGISYPNDVFVITSGNLAIFGHTAALSFDGSIQPRLQSLASSNAAGLGAARFSANAFPPQITLAKSRNGTVGTQSLVSAGDGLGIISFEGSDGNDFEAAAQIEVVSTATPGNNDMPGEMRLKTTPDGSATPVTRVTIDETGDVTLSASLHVTTEIVGLGEMIITGNGTFQAELQVDGDVTVSGDVIAEVDVRVEELVRVGSNLNVSRVTVGIVINQGGNDDDVLEFQSTDVDHDATDEAHTTTYGAIGKASANQGGLEIAGLCSSTNAMTLDAMAVTENSVHNSGASGYFILRARKITAPSVGAPSANANTVVFLAGNGVATHIFNSDGNSWEDGTGWTAYDDYDDASLIELINSALIMSRNTVREEFWAWVRENAAILQQLDLISLNDDGRHFVNRSGLQELLFGFARQATMEIKSLKERVSMLEAMHA